MTMEPATITADAHAGRFRVGARIGEGAIAEVRSAIDLLTLQRVALKTLRPHLRGDSEIVSRFIREGRALAGAAHPNVVRVVAQGADEDGDPWLAMELLEGVSLATLIRREGRLHPPRAVRLAIDIAKALATVHHHGFVHRDIKPENIFVVAPGTPDEHAKLIDFGLAHVTDEELGEYSVRYTRVGRVLGSAAFVAPEHADGVELDPRADVFSLAVTLFEMLTGDLPFEGNSPAEQLEARAHGRVVPLHVRAPGVLLAPSLVSLVMRGLLRERSARPADGLALLLQLRAVERELSPAPQPSRPTLSVPPAAAAELRAGAMVPVPMAEASSGVVGLMAGVAGLVAFVGALLLVARSLHAL